MPSKAAAICRDMRQRALGCVAAALLLAAVLLSGARIEAQSNSVRYVYDDLGRLVAVVDQTGASAIYTYDSVGNLLSISRQSAGAVSILGFAPSAGAAGVTVTVAGTGFSTTPSQNALSFNGTNAVVTSSTSTSLTATVPVGATTGPLSVVTPNGSATSTGSFSVPSSSAPTITGFSPTIGSAATAVTVTGTHFDVTPSNNRLRFNLTPAVITAASSTTLSTTVPTLTASGRISVSTPNGNATSTGDFIIPPSPYVAADVAQSGRVSFGAGTVVSIPAANKIGLLLFDGTAGQRVSVTSSSNSIPGGTALTVIKPDGSTQATVNVSSGTGLLEPQTLAVSGTYTLLVDPPGTSTGSMTVTVYSVPADVGGSIAADGTGVAVSLGTPGQNARFTLAGTTGQRVSLKSSNNTIPVGSTMSIVKPDGTTLASTTVFSNSIGFVDTQVLPVSGTYVVQLDPIGASVGAATLTLYSVPADLSDSIFADGTAVMLSLSTPGQNARLTFTGSSGQRVSLKSSSNTIASAVMGILKPDGSTLTSATVFSGSTGFIEPQTLPASGTYTVLFDPIGANSGGVTLNLYTVPADVTDSIAADGSSNSVSLSTPGQNGRLPFTGSAGQRVSLKSSSNTIASAWMGFLKPDGTTLTSINVFSGTTGFIDLQTLPTSGTYTVLFDPIGANSGGVTLNLYTVPADASASVSVNGGGASLTLGTPGQNGSVTFSGTNGQVITVRVTSNSIGSVTVTLKRPNGTTQTSSVSSATAFNLAQQTLSTTGTYTIAVDPVGANSGGLTVAVTSP